MSKYKKSVIQIIIQCTEWRFHLDMSRSKTHLQFKSESDIEMKTVQVPKKEKTKGTNHLVK